MHASVDSDIFMGRRLLVLLKETNGRKELSGWIFSVYSVLDGVTVYLNVTLLEGEGVASSYE